MSYLGKQLMQGWNRKNMSELGTSYGAREKEGLKNDGGNTTTIQKPT